MYSGLSGRKTTASTNISTGPMIQFCTSDRPSTFRLRKTSPQLLVAHLGKRRVHHQDQAEAIGMLVVPTWKRLMKSSMPGTK